MEKMTRRGFLGALPVAAAAVADLALAAPGPILDLHQHTNYEGRSDAELIAPRLQDR
jgi:hypothetical protein